MFCPVPSIFPSLYLPKNKWGGDWHEKQNFWRTYRVPEFTFFFFFFYWFQLSSVSLNIFNCLDIWSPRSQLLKSLWYDTITCVFGILIVSFQVLQEELLHMVLTKQQQRCSPSHYLLMMFLLPPGLRSISEAPVGPAKNKCKKNRNSGKRKNYLYQLFCDTCQTVWQHDTSCLW